MENLRRLRKAKGLTQKELGEMCDVSESMIGLIENGNRKPSYELLLKLGEALDCSVSTLMEGKVEPAPNNGDGLTEAQRYLIKLIPSLSSLDATVLASVAKSLVDAHKSQGGS